MQQCVPVNIGYFDLQFWLDTVNLYMMGLKSMNSRSTQPLSTFIRRVGASRPGVWTIKHVVSPIDRWLYQRTGGRLMLTGKPVGRILLLTTTGRKSGLDRTTPVFYLRDGDKVILCNVNPGFEKPNPWTLNLRANPAAQVQIGAEHLILHARVANEAETEQYWPRLIAMWPAYQTHYDRSGQRTIFVLEPGG